jgi:hypothetical protein
LHRIADAEQRAPIARREACRQPLKQIELREGRVLELIDQNVSQAMIERERQIGRIDGAAERPQGAQRSFHVVGLAVRLEHELQFGDGARQHLEQCFEHMPLFIRILCRWQRT